MRAYLVCLLLLALAACTPPPAPMAERGPEALVLPAPLPATGAPTPVAVLRPSVIDSVLAGLDHRCLVGQMIVVYRAHNEFLLQHDLGGVLLFKSMLGDPQALRRELDALQAAAPVPYLVALDQEGGAVSRLDAVPGWGKGTPGAVEMAGWTESRVRAEGARIGAALADLGVNLNLAPVLDSALAWDGSEGWMGRRRRAFGVNAAEIVGPARAFALGCGEAGVVCLAKHFPGYDVAENSDLEPARSGADRAAIQRGAGPFAALADATAGVMMSSIIYPPLGAEPAVLCPAAVALARKAVPHGVVMTDDLWGTALRAWQRPDLQILPTEYPDADWLALAEGAVRAGNDLLLVTYPVKAVLMQEMLASRLDEDPELQVAVRAAVRRVLVLKQNLGLLAGD